MTCQFLRPRGGHFASLRQRRQAQIPLADSTGPSRPVAASCASACPARVADPQTFSCIARSFLRPGGKGPRSDCRQWPGFLSGPAHSAPPTPSALAAGKLFQGLRPQPPAAFVPRAGSRVIIPTAYPPAHAAPYRSKSRLPLPPSFDGQRVFPAGAAWVPPFGNAVGIRPWTWALLPNLDWSFRPGGSRAAYCPLTR